MERGKLRKCQTVEHHDLEATVKPPYNDMGYITIFSILRFTPLISPFLV